MTAKANQPKLTPTGKINKSIKVKATLMREIEQAMEERGIDDFTAFANMAFRTEVDMLKRERALREFDLAELAKTALNQQETKSVESQAS